MKVELKNFVNIIYNTAPSSFTAIFQINPNYSGFPQITNFLFSFKIHLVSSCYSKFFSS